METRDVFNPIEERTAVGRKPEAGNRTPNTGSREAEAGRQLYYTCCRASPSETSTSNFFFPR